MEVDDEERKVEVGEFGGVDDDEDDDEEMERKDDDEDSENDDEDVLEDGSDPNEKSTERATPAVENPFLDSFYSLSAPDPKERSQAAQVMLSHCLLGPSSNSKDAAYAFRRLLNGLCSGRAAARQGNASALASFLKIAFQLDKMNEVRGEAENDSDQNSSSLLNYIRERLLSTTDPNRTQGKKKGSEERDYHFGRLFGILGVVRSGILLLPGDDNDIREVAAALVADLIELFWHRRWMREPAAHGVSAMLHLFFGSTTKTSQKIGWHLVEEVILPKILIVTHDDRREESDLQTLIEKYCAEQIGIAAYIQSRSLSNDLPYPLDQPIISTKTLPWMGQALSETSAIVQPRTHFVWDAIWCYLTEKADEENSSGKKIAAASSQYNTRKTIPLGEDRVVDVIDAIMKIVVEEKLLRIEKGSSVAKTTHERKSLALCVVRNLCGVPFVSSISGPTQIIVHSDAIENVVLSKDIIRYLFMDVVSAGKKRQDGSHLLKPLAIEILASWVEATVQSGDMNRQLACLKAITNCHPRFDAFTKTRTISDLLVSSNDSVTIAEQCEFWEKCFTHLESKFLESCSSTEDTEAHGYIELMYTCTKNILHSSTDEEDRNTEITEYKTLVAKRVLGFFMSTAFFDCSTLTKSTNTMQGKKGSHPSSTPQTITQSALKVQASLQDGQKIAYPIRVMISSRFFSLVSDFVMTVSHDSKDEENTKVEKDSNTLAILEEICENWIELESNEAQRFVPVEDDDDKDDDDDDDSPERIITDLRRKVVDLGENAGADKESVLFQSKKRCMTGIAVLAITLHLHRLNCGSDDTMDDNPDADEEEDEENICSAIADLEGVSSDFFKGNEEDSNPLLGLSEICANILSSPLGSGDIGRGAAPKLVREAIKYAWLGGLKLASTTATREKTLFDDSVVGLLMDAIGASNENADTEDDPSEMDEDDDESDEESDDDLIFSKASKVFNDPEDMEDDEQDISEKESDESDIELDPSRLHTMLEEENLDDVDDIPLEHHEGADAALAKLIKLKQEARKAGQEARERIEVSNQ
jgi:DNA polymerase phi